MATKPRLHPFGPILRLDVEHLATAKGERGPRGTLCHPHN